MRALIISADEFEDSELLVPLEQLQKKGIATDVAALKKGRIRGKHGNVVQVSLAVDEVDESKYNLLILPGGRAPARLRKDPAVLSIVRAFNESGKPIAAICHGPQILISAGLLRGRAATAYKSVAMEMKQAGIHYEDKEVVVDDNLITSRKPADLAAFMRAIEQRIGVPLVEP